MNKDRKQATVSKVEAVPTENLNINGLSVIAKHQDATAEEPEFKVLEEPKKKTIFEVMKFVQNKYTILEKLEVLNQTEKSLDSFNLGKDGFRDNLQITDGEGNKFNTSNTQVIERVIEVIKAEISLKREAVELELATDL